MRGKIEQKTQYGIGCDRGLSRIAFVSFIVQMIIFSHGSFYHGRANNFQVIFWGLVFLIEEHMSKRCRQKKQEAQQ